MSSLSAPADAAAAFQAALLHLINDILPGLRPSAAAVPWQQPVDAATPLFEGGRIDSLSIVHLMAAIEDLTGRQVPDHLVSMQHFRTVDTITRTFFAPDPMTS